MAVTQEIEPVETALPVEPKPKNKGGRPSNESRRVKLALDAQARTKEIAKQLESEPAPPAEDDAEEIPNDPFRIAGRGKEDWFQWLSQTFEPSMWANQLMIYLWRTGPCIDRKAIGKASHVCKYVESVDVTRIMLDYGSGDYRLDLVGVDEHTGKAGRISQHRCSIMNTNFPPKVPVGEWIDDPINQNWLWAKPALEAAMQKNSPAYNNGAPAMNLDPSLMLKNVAETYKSMQPPTPDNTLLNTLIAGVLNKPADPMLAYLLEQQKQDREDRRAEASRQEKRESDREARETAAREAAAKPKSILEQIQELEPVVKLLGPKTRETKSDAMDYVMRIGEKLVEAAPALLTAWRLGTIGPQPVAGFNGQTAAVPAPVHYAPAAQQAALAAETQQPIEGAADLTPEQQARLQVVIERYGPLIQSVAMTMIDHFKHETGYFFRDWFIDRKGIELYHEMQESTGAELLTAAAQEHGYLRMQLAPPDKLRIFLDQFFVEPGTEPEGTFVDEDEETAKS